MIDEEKNVIWHEGIIQKIDRQRLLGQKSCVLWFTGLSGSGKSTIATHVEEKLHHFGVATYLLDGDNIRHGLNKDLSFTSEDRKENIRRIGEVAKLFVDSGIVVLTAFISPFIEERKKVRELLGEHEFIEIYTKCTVEACEARDPKGLYKKAREGGIANFTGISSPYEVPSNPEIILDTENMTIDDCSEKVIEYLKKGNYININL
jgi:adenylylsulfate kinase